MFLLFLLLFGLLIIEKKKFFYSYNLDLVFTSLFNKYFVVKSSQSSLSSVCFILPILKSTTLQNGAQSKKQDKKRRRSQQNHNQVKNSETKKSVQKKVVSIPEPDTLHELVEIVQVQIEEPRPSVEHQAYVENSESLA